MGCASATLRKSNRVRPSQGVDVAAAVDWNDVLCDDKEAEVARSDVQKALANAGYLCSAKIKRRIWKRVADISEVKCRKHKHNEFSRQILVDIERTHKEKDISDDSGCKNIQDFRNKVGQILETHQKKYPGACYVQGQHMIVAFLLQRGAPAAVLFTRILDHLKLARFYEDDFVGIRAAADAMKGYFAKSDRQSFCANLEKSNVTFLIILLRWLPALFLTAGLTNDSAETLFTLYLACSTSKEAALLILRTAIHLLESSDLDSKKTSTASIFEWLNGSGKQIHFGALASIVIPNDALGTYHRLF